MVDWRVAWYIVGIMFSLLTAGTLWAAKDSLAKVFAGAMLVWAAACCLLMVSRVYILENMARPWHAQLFSILSMLLGLSPISIYGILCWRKTNGSDKTTTAD